MKRRDGVARAFACVAFGLAVAAYAGLIGADPTTMFCTGLAGFGLAAVIVG